MGRHTRRSHTMRNALIVGTTAAAGIGALFAVPASAAVDHPSCTDNARNPAVRVCQDDPRTGSDSLHALVRLDPLCVHIAIPDGRQVVSTEDCRRHGTTPVGVIPVYPTQPAPGDTVPCTCTTPPVEQPPAEVPAPVAEAPADTVPAPEAPAPVIINNNTASSPLPAVTH